MHFDYENFFYYVYLYTFCPFQLYKPSESGRGNLAVNSIHGVLGQDKTAWIEAEQLYTQAYLQVSSNIIFAFKFVEWLLQAFLYEQTS